MGASVSSPSCEGGSSSSGAGAALRFGAKKSAREPVFEGRPFRRCRRIVAARSISTSSSRIVRTSRRVAI
jgi:hypothetical protein